ncbi:MAG: TldD/PmbA family protein [Methanomicrobia archaeon]|nr:TldD/PmbA family protein [Methanomicrobia archaeon]MCK4637698.1 TldD/PmbA family protein [Methanomicrobia archaeon]
MDLIDEALEIVSNEGAYGDIRIVERRWENIEIKNDNIERLENIFDRGFGIRVLLNGAWGFASSSNMERDEVRKKAKLAIKIARASAKLKKKDVKLSETKIYQDTYKTKIKKDPFKIPTEERIDVLMESVKRMDKEKIVLRMGDMQLLREKKTFASTENAFIDQEITEVGGSITAMAAKPGDIQKRCYPTSFGGDYHTEGYEFIESIDLVGNAERVAEDAVLLLDAEQCPSKKTDLIIDTSQMMLQIHESCGHPTELDRVFGTEANYAGTSFLTLEKLNNFRYGSDLVNITADAAIEGGLGTFGYDDEGVKAQKTYLVKDGIFSGYLTSRETAREINQESNGTMRADGWSKVPIIRMTNINLLPGDYSKEELIEETKDGLYVETNKSWSIDDKRLNFLFGTEVGYTIENGEFKNLVKNPTYTGITYEFWRNLVAIGNDWHVWGVPNCGKGQPGQSAHVGHGVPTAKFENIMVGVGKW